MLASTVSVFSAQSANAEILQVIEVQLKPTDKGIALILETKNCRFPQVFPTRRYRQTIVIDIINTQLALPSGISFRRENPVSGITKVSVRQLDTNSTLCSNMVWFTSNSTQVKFQGLNITERR